MSSAVMPLKDYKDTCDTIREKTGTTELIKSGELADKVSEVYVAGYSESELNYWNGFTNSGTRKNYDRAFAECDMEGINIPELCKPVGTYQMFYNYVGKRLPNGLDFSDRWSTGTTPNFGRFGHEFSFAYSLEYVYDLNFPASDSLNQMFGYCRKLKTIDKIRVKEETVYTNTFVQNYALADVTFEGVIGQNISFADSPLTLASMKSIISCLKDYSGTDKAGTYTLTLKDTCKTELQENTDTITFEKNDGTEVTCTYFQAITEKGWNLA